MTDSASGARALIINAFNRLILSGRREKPRVAEVLSEAGVARSTFYEHFDGRDGLLVTSMRGPLSILVDAAVGTPDAARLASILDHFKENRRAAVEIFESPLGKRVMRELAGMIAERPEAAGLSKYGPTHLADLLLGNIRLWLCGETPYQSRDLANLLIASARAQRAALSGPAAD